jgi:hypothetical protein
MNFSKLISNKVFPALALLIIAYSYLIFRHYYPPLSSSGSAALNYSEEKPYLVVHVNASDEYKNYTVNLPLAADISRLRLFPFRQPHVKLQIEYLKLFSQNNVVYEQSFMVNPDGLISHHELIGASGMKLSNVTSGSILELTAFRRDAHIDFHLPETTKADRIEFRMRAVETWKELKQ